MCKVISSAEDVVRFIDDNYTQLILRAYRITNDMSLAEDLLHDVVIEISNKEDLGKINNPIGFILTVIQRRGIDFHRKNNTQLLEYFDSAELKKVAFVNQGLSSIELSTFLDDLAKKARLNDIQNKYFELIRDGLSNKQIAQKLKVSPDYVRKFKQTIMRRLRKAIEND